MTQSLMRLDLTSREFRVVFFLIDEIQGNQMKQRAIKTSQFISSTAIPKQKVIPAINSLIEKGVIRRTQTSEPGWYLYEFNETVFGRTHATKDIHQDKRKFRLLQGGVPKTDTHDAGTSTQNDDSRVPKTGTSPRSNFAPDPLRGEKNFQEEKERHALGGKKAENESHFESQMREHEERKKQETPRGSMAFADSMRRFKEKGLYKGETVSSA